MSKEVQMTFRVEPELRSEFADAALQENRPAAQVLREYRHFRNGETPARSSRQLRPRVRRTGRLHAFRSC